MDATAFFDVVVVGAGPSGSALARQLRRGGFDVLLTDRGLPGTKNICGGFLGPEIEDILRKQELESVLGEAAARRIGGVVVSGPQTPLFESAFGRRAWAVSRKHLDGALCQRARAEGVRFLAKAKLLGARPRRGIWHSLFETEQGAFHAASRYLVFAHGRRPGPSSENSFFACKTVYDVARDLNDRVALHFVQKGHVGLNPFHAGVTACLFVHRSVISAARGDLDRMMVSLGQENPWIARQLGDSTRTEAWSVCQAEPDGRFEFCENGIFRVGDAVTMINPIIGGGIPVALASAGLLAECLLEGCAKNRRSEETALDYRKRWFSLFSRRLWVAKMLGGMERRALASRSFFTFLKSAPFAFPSVVSFSRKM